MTKITLLLAQGPGKPDGDVQDRLVMHLDLNSQGHIDTAAYEAAPRPWLATRTNGTHQGGTKALEVIRIEEGWALQSMESLDDPVWAFEGHVFRPGELVQLRQPDGQPLLFRIVGVEAG